MLRPEPSQRVEGRQKPPISCREIEMGDRKPTVCRTRKGAFAKLV